MSNEIRWQKAYKKAWNELFGGLSKIGQQTVLASPDGANSADLAARASTAADNQIALEDSFDRTRRDYGH